jgi:hypothetical protein
MDTHFCKVCKVIKPIGQFGKDKSMALGIRNSCKGCMKQQLSKYYCRSTEGKKLRRHQIKKEGILAYGGKCNCCGESNPFFLTIEHKFGRSKDDDFRSAKMWSYLKRNGWPQDKYELLCFNCNCAKNILGYCPHKVDGVGLEPTTCSL